MSDDLDFRVSCGLFDHPKWMRLDAALGDRGGMALIRLWGWARRHRPNGDLSGLSDREVAAAARWRGKPGTLIEALTDAGFLDRAGERATLHDWLAHQPHSANTKGFQRAQRLKAVERWAKRAGMAPDAYARHSFGMSLDDYLNGPQTDARHMPGIMPGNAARMPPPSLPPHPPTTPHPPGTEPRATGGIGYPPGVEATPNQSEPSGLGRSLPVPVRPQDAPIDPQEAQAAAAHRLELAIGCTFKQAHAAVQGLAMAGADAPWIEARIAASTGTSPKPWDWVKATKDALAVHQGKAAAPREWKPFFPLRILKEVGL